MALRNGKRLAALLLAALAMGAMLWRVTQRPA